MARTDRVLWARQLVQQVKARSKSRGITCTITSEDTPIPDVCPALGIPLVRAVDTLSLNSASIDRIRPELGYIPGNVVVVSLKANMIKSSATAEEILAVGQFYKTLQ